VAQVAEGAVPYTRKMSDQMLANLERMASAVVVEVALPVTMVDLMETHLVLRAVVAAMALSTSNTFQPFQLLLIHQVQRESLAQQRHLLHQI
jgi:hypothetical protein